MRKIEDRTFLALIVVVSLAFAWVLLPFFGAILWALIAGILFEPLNRRVLARFPGHPNLAALLTLLVIVAMVILPAITIGIFLLQEATAIYARIEGGQIDVGGYFRQVQALLPDWAISILRRLGLSNIGAIREKIADGVADSFQVLAAQTVVIGQRTFGFLVGLGVMLYLIFFFLRDGDALVDKLRGSIPLHPAQRNALIAKFVTVIRATVKGSIVVAILQGAVGGVVFWSLGIHGALLWGVLMGFLSLLPAVGTGLVWVPVAIYLLVTGSIWQSVVLVFCGFFVIGLIDNILRPILVGRDARMPDYIVLVSTLGGIELFGLNGIVIGPVIAALFMAVWEIVAAGRRSGWTTA